MLSHDQFGLPPEYGSTPVPEGMVRFNHYTFPSSVPGIREHGLLRSRSEEAFGKMATEHPQIFATAGEPDKDTLRNRPVVEGWADPSKDLDIGSDWPAHDLEERRSVITMRGDVPPDRIIAVHEPWHHNVRTILGDEHYLRDTLSGANDHALDDPDWGPAIRYVKRMHGVE
jgi:hypothetical protein